MSNVKHIEDLSFVNCSALESIILDCVRTIGNYAFKNCTSLELVSLSEMIENIKNEAFVDCANLRVVKIKNPEPPEKGNDTFKRNAQDRVFYIPFSSKDKYKKEWPGYADSIVGYDFENDKVVD